MPLKTLLTLLGINAIWSAHPVMGKFVLESFTPSQGAWLRYASALAAYALMSIAWGDRPRFARPKSKSDWGWLVLLGFCTFCFSPLLQMIGLEASRATDNAIIISIEPLMTVFLAWLMFRDPLRPAHWLSFALALLGFSALSGLTPGRIARGLDSHLTGNLILLVALLGDASFSALGRKLMPRYPPAAIFGTSIFLGVGILTLVVLSVSGLPDLASVSWRSVGALFWLGPVGTAFCYLYWMHALRNAPIASMAVTLFLQPVLGATWGVLFLNERLDLLQTAGAVVIVLAVIIPSLNNSLRSGT